MLRCHIWVSKMSSLSILSFNVLAQAWIDAELRKNALGKRHLTKSYRFAKQVQVLENFDADVVLLQEVTPEALEYFESELPQYRNRVCYASVIWRPYRADAPESGNAVLWKERVFSQAECANIDLNAYGNRAAMVTGTLEDGACVRIVGVHLEYGDIQRAAEQFQSLFTQRLVQNRAHVIIGGDFNMGEPEFPIREKFERHGFMNCVPDNSSTHPFVDGPDAKGIDHILVRGFRKKRLVIGASNSIGDCLRRYGSDHYPVYVVLAAR
jgi:endonuclease/exonuclease/phosphatase family metal-dependent hydrolase